MRLSSRVSTADTEYGTVLLDEHNGTYYQLNRTGTLVIRTLLAGGAESDAVRALTAEFDVDSTRASRDVAELLALLRSAGLVTP